MAEYASIAGKNNNLIRKAVQGSVFIAPASAALVTDTTLFSATGGIILPAGYKDIGWTTEDGVTFARAVSATDVTSWGSSAPTRSDITSDVTTVAVTAQETKLQTVGLITGVDTTTVVPKAATGGSVTIQQPNIATPRSYRLLSISVDTLPAGEFYMIRFLPNVKITDFGDEVSNGNDPVVYPLTFTAYPDATAGYSQARYYGGPGFASASTAMGFPAAV